MPVQSPLTKKSSIVHRSESLRSEVSDASQQSKRVSFNRDVAVKRIPRGSAVVDRNGKLVAVLDGVSSSGHSGGTIVSSANPNFKKKLSSSDQINGRLWVNSLAPSKEALPEEELLREAQTILKHVDSISCSTSGGAYDTRSLERNSSRRNNNNNNSSNNKNSANGTSKSNGTKLQKSSSRLSEFFSKTLPNQLRNKYNSGNSSNNNHLTKSTQNLVTHTNSNGSSTTSSGAHSGSIEISIPEKTKLKLRRSVSSDFSIGNLNGSISKSDPNLYKSGNPGNARYKKVAKIKKPHGIRAALNSIGETPTNSSSSRSSSGSGSDELNSLNHNISSTDNDNSNGSSPKKVSTSESPVSSLSGPEEPSMASPLARDLAFNGRSVANNNNNSNNIHQQRVSSIVQQLANRRGQESPERSFNSNNISSSFSSSRPVVEPLVGNTHNNNKPFSYISGLGNNAVNSNNSGGISPTKPERSPNESGNKQSPTTPSGKILSSPKEVIYAQVVCSGKPGEPGTGEKRTVHTTITNGVNKNSSNHNNNHNSNSDSNPSSNRSSPQRVVNNNNSSDSPDLPSSVSPNTIQHFVYDSHHNKNSTDSNKMNHQTSFRNSGIGSGYRRMYDDYDFSTAKPRNNVTTVLLNNVDDEDDTSFSSSRHNINSHFNSSNNYNNHTSTSYRNQSPSPSPNYRKAPEHSFYFGNSPSPGDYSSSSFNYKTPTRPNGYLSRSREVSPATKANAVASALLVRDAERKKDSIVSSAKLVSTYGSGLGNGSNINNSAHHTDYDYMSSRFDNDSSSRQSPSRTYNSNINNSTSFSDSFSRSKPEPTTTSNSRLRDYSPSSNFKHSRSNSPARKLRLGSNGSKTGTPNASNNSVNKIGLRSKENSPVRTSYNRDYSKSASPGKTTTGTLRRDESSLERKYNRKNKDEENHTEKTSTLKTTTNTTTTNNSGSGGGGYFSTLMRRSKDKKIQKEIQKEKEKEKKENVNINNNTNGNNSNNEGSDQVDSKESKIKRQRAKFFSAFLDKNFSSKNKNPAASESNNNNSKSNNKTGKNTAKPTDSEIEEAERRRDGEYHSWSSNDDEYRFGHHRYGQPPLTRGKSYNFGDLNDEESGTKPWYDQNEESDYRRELATSRYPSATLGRPGGGGMRSSNHHDSDNANISRSKSLDRRAYKNRSRSRSPPRIIVTPNTPAVDEGDKWKNTYDPIIRSFDRDRTNGNPHSYHHSNHHPTLSKKMSGLSKSSYELDDPHLHHNRGGSTSSGKLRYFGDTDAEDLHSHHHGGKSSHSGHHSSGKFIPRSSSYLSRGKDNYSKYYTVPGSSLNSSGSENGSRMSKGSSNAGSQRSVYLHAPAVAAIPPSGMQRRTLSRDELSNYSGSQKQTKHLARSMSVLAPWRPRHYRERYEVNYNHDGKENQLYSRPPKPPRSPTRKSMSPSRAGSTDSLLKLSDDRRSKSPVKSGGTLSRKENSLSRSKSMPKDTRVSAGWRSTLRWPRFGRDKDKISGEGKT